MKTAIGLQLNHSMQITYYEQPNWPILLNEHVVVEREGVLEMAQVRTIKTDCSTDDFLESSLLIKRVMNHEDHSRLRENEAKIPEIISTSKRLVEENQLPMKIIQAFYSLMRDKLTIQFNAQERIDFRKLVKDLAAIYKVRIELRQIGVRDEAQVLGGIGVCGRPLCCSTFLGNFTPVSIKMARMQDLSLNPNKISGMCGRLMCCLSYENEVYEHIRKQMPDYGSTIDTPEGQGRVVGLDILNMIATIQLNHQGKIIQYDFSELSVS